MPRLLAPLSFLAFAASAALAATGAPMVPWDADHSLARARKIGPFTVVGRSPLPDPADPTGKIARLELTDAQGRRGALTAEVAFDDVSASLGVGRFDPASPLPQLLLTSFTGGAHCCVHIQLLDFLDGRWRAVEVGSFDGEAFAAMPTDLDGDGVLDIEHWDDRFAYAFDSYAGSWMPPRVWSVRAGKVADVSGEARFRPLFVRDYARAKAQCEMDSNGACAGLVADGARTGQLDQAWAVALAHFKPDAQQPLPGCKVAAREGHCPKAARFGAAEARAAITQFLRRNGYLPAGG